MNSLPCQRPRHPRAIADGCVERDMDYGEGGPTYRVHFAVTYGGCPMRWSSMDHPGEPAEGPEWEITEVEAERWDEHGNHYWTPIENVNCREGIQAIWAWAEMLDLSEDAAEATTDQHELYRESEADNRRDPLE